MNRIVRNANDFINKLCRKTVVTGHYGSGKTEFSVSLAMIIGGQGSEQKLKAQNIATRVALIDLDIVNPYFRSREQRKKLETAGIQVYGSVYDKEITAELPAIGATVRTPLEDKNCRVILDLGGNDSGALIINQFAKYFTDDETMMVAVVNANRPDSRTADAVIEHITAIEAVTGLTVSSIVNNTHMLHETSANDIEKGHKLCKEVCGIIGKELLCDCFPAGIIDPKALTGLSDNLMPLGLYMRFSWLAI